MMHPGLRAQHPGAAAERRFLTEEEKLALAKGNSDEQIRVNKEKYDYSKVIDDDRRSMAEKWFMAPKPSTSTGAAYYQWRVWNVAKTNEGKDVKFYKGDLIIEKATGRSVSPPQWESEEEEEDIEDEKEVTEATVAMAAVRVE